MSKAAAFFEPGGPAGCEGAGSATNIAAALRADRERGSARDHRDDGWVDELPLRLSTTSKPPTWSAMPRGFGERPGRYSGSQADQAGDGNDADQIEVGQVRREPHQIGGQPSRA